MAPSCLLLSCLTCFLLLCRLLSIFWSVLWLLLHVDFAYFLMFVCVWQFFWFVFKLLTLAASKGISNQEDRHTSPMLWNWGVVWRFDTFPLLQNMCIGLAFPFYLLKNFFIFWLFLFRGSQNQSFQPETLSFKQEDSQFFFKKKDTLWFEYCSHQGKMKSDLWAWQTIINFSRMSFFLLLMLGCCMSNMWSKEKRGD